MSYPHPGPAVAAAGTKPRVMAIAKSYDGYRRRLVIVTVALDESVVVETKGVISISLLAAVGLALTLTDHSKWAAGPMHSSLYARIP
jgi:hypothetical protein